MRTIDNKKSFGGQRAGYLASGLLLFLLALVGCTKEELPGDAVDDNSDPEEVVFGALVGESVNPATRAVTGYNIVTYLYGASDFHMSVYNNDTQAPPSSSIYEIPSGKEGTISPKYLGTIDGEMKYADALNWQNREDDHYFYGWAAPRSFFEYTREYAEQKVEEGVLEQDAIPEDLIFPIEQMDDGNIRINFVDNDLFEAASGGSWKATFSPENLRGTSGVGTTGTDGATKLPYHWKNGEILERLIGACNPEPLKYKQNGKYVPLQFHHLVSKIHLSSLLITDNSTGTGSTTERGYITFYGMPQTATLYAHPKKDGHPVAPYVDVEGGMANWDYDQTEGVKYAITNYSRSYYWEYSGSSWYASYSYRDAWYICPEVDFSKISFKIEIYEYSSTEKKWIPSTKHGKHGAYYGDFKNVTFSRTGSGYDDDQLPDGSRPDLKTLHAGEYMTLTIRMSEKGNPEAKATISDWSSNTRTGNTHVYPGIYDVTELKDMASYMQQDETSREQFYDEYGSGHTTADDPEGEYPDYKQFPKNQDADGNGKELKLIEIYDDIGTEGSHYSYSSQQMDSNLYVDEDYMLDGNGHTINMGSSSNVNLGSGNVRDVYFKCYYYYSSTSYYEYIIYIDKMGNVWKVDPASYEMTPANDSSGNQYNVNTFEDKTPPVYLNLSTGALS